MSDFIKTSKQKEAIQTLIKFKYALLYGGSRSGKTAIIIFAIIVRASKCKSRHAIIRNTLNAVKRSIFLDTLPKVLQLAFPDLRVKFHKSDFYIILPNGSEIWLFGLDDKKAERILGMEFSTLFFEEASELDYSSIQMALSRLAEKNTLDKKVYFAENPPTKNHWSYWLFVKKLDPVDEIPLENPEQYGHLLMNPIDNLDNLDPEYLKLLGQMPEKDRKRFLQGLFTDIDDGVAYYAFDRDTHVKGTEFMAGTIFIGTDFNVNPMASVICQYYDGVFYIHDEIFLKNSDTFKMVNNLKRKKYFGTVIPDSTGKNRKTSGKSDFEILKGEGYQIMSTKNPFVSDRVNNVNRLFTQNRVIINPKCRKLINDLSKVAWKDNKLDQKTDPMLTHISDALGYVMWGLDPISKPMKSTQTVV